MDKKISIGKSLISKNSPTYFIADIASNHDGSLNKAKELESNMKESREKIKKITAEGVSGGGNVKITLNGDNEIVEIKISKEIYNENLNIIEDLIKAAHNNAKASLKSKTEEEISKLTGGLGIPGFKWPI